MRVREPTETMYDVIIRSSNNRIAGFVADSIKLDGDRLFIYSELFGNVTIKLERADTVSICLLKEGD